MDMRKRWEQLLALLLSVLLVLPTAALAVDNGEDGEPGSGNDKTAQVSLKGTSWTWDNDVDTVVKAGVSTLFPITMKEGSRLKTVLVKIAGEDAEDDEEGVTIELNADTLTGTNNGITATIDAWPARSRTFSLTVGADASLADNLVVSVSATTESIRSSARIHEESG